MDSFVDAVAFRPANPMDLVEETAVAREWSCERTGKFDFVAEVPGRWCRTNLLFAWSEEIGALMATFVFDVSVPPERRAALYELLAMANDQLCVGHFDHSAADGMLAFRHSLLLRGGAMSAEQIEDLVDIALTEIDRFYPAFQYVAWGGLSPADALAAAMLDTVGEA